MQPWYWLGRPFCTVHHLPSLLGQHVVSCPCFSVFLRKRRRSGHKHMMLSCILSQSSHRSISIILSRRHAYQWMNWPKLRLCLCESWVGMRRMGAIYSIYSYGHHPAYPTSHWLRHSKRKTSAASGTWDAQKGQPSNCSGSSWIGLAMAAPKSHNQKFGSSTDTSLFTLLWAVLIVFGSLGTSMPLL